jgi:hypothetical protein
MAIEVDLYRSDDYALSGRVSLLPILRAAFEPLLGLSLDGARFRLAFLPVPAATGHLDGDPVLVNLRNSHGYVHVRIVQNGRLLYQHPHSVGEIVARPLQRLLAASQPDEHHWGFAIVGPGLEEWSFVRPAPEIAMSVDIGRDSGRLRMFHVEEMPEPEPAAATPAELGAPLAEPGDAPVVVILEPDAQAALAELMPFSDNVEEGGFLAGHVYSDATRPGNYVVVVTAVLRAERTGASLLHFTFTGDSFLRVGDVISGRGADEVLVGWYHSHLFPASSALGLSSIDVDLHTNTFRRPWQVAGLVNLSADTRLVRFYAERDGRMMEVPIWVSER